MAINVPVFYDEETPRPFKDSSIPDRKKYAGDQGMHCNYSFSSFSLLMEYVPSLRGLERGGSARAYLYGRNGLWNGMLLLAGISIILVRSPC